MKIINSFACPPLSMRDCTRQHLLLLLLLAGYRFAFVYHPRYGSQCRENLLSATDALLIGRADYILKIYNEHTEQPAPESLRPSNIPCQHGRDLIVAACSGTATSPLLSESSCSAQSALIGRKSCTSIKTDAVC